MKFTKKDLMMELLSNLVAGVMPGAYCSAISLPCAARAILYSQR